jgi:PPOX class probable F420-dependent enzyme
MLHQAQHPHPGWHENPTLEAFTRTKTILLTTYRRDGTPVATPVSFAVHEGRAYFRTWNRSGKAKRLRRNPSVEIAPSTLDGKQKAPAMRARAHLLTGSDALQAKQALARRHALLQGLLVPLAHRLMRYRTVHYELIPDVD